MMVTMAANERPVRWLWLKRIVAPLVASPIVGRIAARVYRDRIPHRGLVIDTAHPMIAARTKASLLINRYESAEYRFMREFLPRDADVVELGGSLGVMSCLILATIDRDRRLVSVEADDRLVTASRNNLAINGFADRATVVFGAIDYSGADTVSFGAGATSIDGRVGAVGTAGTASVPARTLGAVIGDYGLTHYSIVCDIEGAEWAMFATDRAAVLGAAAIILETHDGQDGRRWTDFVAQVRADPAFEVLAQYGPVLALRPRETGMA